jgi:hypothetical protein
MEGPWEFAVGAAVSSSRSSPGIVGGPLAERG